MNIFKGNYYMILSDLIIPPKENAKRSTCQKTK